MSDLCTIGTKLYKNTAFLDQCLYILTRQALVGTYIVQIKPKFDNPG